MVHWNASEIHAFVRLQPEPDKFHAFEVLWALYFWPKSRLEWIHFGSHLSRCLKIWPKLTLYVFFIPCPPVINSPTHGAVYRNFLENVRANRISPAKTLHNSTTVNSIPKTSIRHRSESNPGEIVSYLLSSFPLIISSEQNFALLSLKNSGPIILVKSQVCKTSSKCTYWFCAVLLNSAIHLRHSFREPTVEYKICLPYVTLKLWTSIF